MLVWVAVFPSHCRAAILRQSQWLMPLVRRRSAASSFPPVVDRLFCRVKHRNRFLKLGVLLLGEVEKVQFLLGGEPDLIVGL